MLALHTPARSALQPDESGAGRGEPAGVEVEGLQVIVEVDVEPFAARRTMSLAHCDGHDLRSDALMASGSGDHRVLDRA